MRFGGLGPGFLRLSAGAADGRLRLAGAIQRSEPVLCRFGPGGRSDRTGRAVRNSGLQAATQTDPRRHAQLPRSERRGDPAASTPKQAFKIATQNSFDYSAVIFVGLTSLIAEGGNKHPQLGDGIAGYGRYYWRGFLDKTDGNYLVLFALPTIFHQDERYYAMGEGRFWKRGVYAASRVLITPDYHGHKSFNASEVLGRAMAQGISTAYYPSHDRTLGALASKFGYALMRDAVTHVFREFWPNIATHVLHRHP